MLNRKYRLTKNSAFNATYRIKHSYCVGGIVLWVGKKKDKPQVQTRVGFVVSNKTHKRAVRRNRLKRLMRESYRLLLKEGDFFAAEQYLSLIFVGYEKALDSDLKNTKEKIYKLLKQIRG